MQKGNKVIKEAMMKRATECTFFKIKKLHPVRGMQEIIYLQIKK